MSRVVYSDAARADALEIAEYIGQHNLSAAERVICDFDRILALMAAFPMAGERADHVSPGLRRARSGNYLLFYRVRDDHIEVARIVHGARDIGSQFP